MEAPKPKVDYIITSNTGLRSIDIVLESEDSKIFEKITKEGKRFGSAYHHLLSSNDIIICVRPTFDIVEVRDYMDNYIWHLLYT
jgi:hypothetical protein